MGIEAKISERLGKMALESDPDNSLWPENCAGSREALVIFIGPSPGGKKEENRRSINREVNKPLWNESFDEPTKGWSKGFQKSFPPIVEAIFDKSYEIAAKLIARFNMDWLQNPKSADVSYRFMWEGCSLILPILYQCNPSLIIPMDEKTFGVLQMALYNDGFEISLAKIGDVKIKIYDKKRKARYHTGLMAFKAQKDEKSFIVIKSMQHPARIYDVAYAERIGKAIRLAFEQISMDEIVDINLQLYR